MPSVTLSEVMDWTLNQAPQCKTQVPEYHAPMLTFPAETDLSCALICIQEQECVSVYYNSSNCKLYSAVANKDCSGFVQGAAGYYEIRRVSMSTLFYP